MSAPNLRTPFDSTAEPVAERERQACLVARMESLSLLAGGVAHDLNNILTAVLGFGTLLAENVASDPDAAGNAAEVLAAAGRAAALTQQLLAFSRRQLLAPARVDVAGMVGEMQGRLQDALGGEVALDLAIADVVPAACVDRERLEDALMVLADNAVDAMPGGGRLTIRVDSVSLDHTEVASHHFGAAGAYVRLSMTDTGSGMAREVLDRIFEPFYTTKPRGQGAGLGLSTVYGFVRQSGGFIRVSSAPTLGSTFTIHLPVFGSQRDNVGEASSGPQEGGGGARPFTTEVLVQKVAALLT